MQPSLVDGRRSRRPALWQPRFLKIPTLESSPPSYSAASHLPTPKSQCNTETRLCHVSCCREPLTRSHQDKRTTLLQLVCLIRREQLVPLSCQFHGTGDNLHLRRIHSVPLCTQLRRLHPYAVMIGGACANRYFLQTATKHQAYGAISCSWQP